MQSEPRQQYNCHVTGKQLGVRALLNLACIKRYIEFSLHQGSFLFPGQHLEVLRVTSGGSRRRECLKPAKKRALRRPERCAAQVLASLSTVEPPPPEGKAKRLSRISSIRHRHLAGRGAGAKRPARSERSEIPSEVQRRRNSPGGIPAYRLNWRLNV